MTKVILEMTKDFFENDQGHFLGPTKPLKIETYGNIYIKAQKAAP